MDEVNSIIMRLSYFLDKKKISKSQFADTCGIPRPTVSQLFSGKIRKVGDDIINTIHETFPEIPMMWLLFGDGENPKFLPNESKPHENLIFDACSQSSMVNTNVVATGEISERVIPIKPNKEISKIVVFFTDNSFEEYYMKK